MEKNGKGVVKAVNGIFNSDQGDKRRKSNATKLSANINKAYGKPSPNNGQTSKMKNQQNHKNLSMDEKTKMRIYNEWKSRRHGFDLGNPTPKPRSKKAVRRKKTVRYADELQPIESTDLRNDSDISLVYDAWGNAVHQLKNPAATCATLRRLSRWGLNEPPPIESEKAKELGLTDEQVRAFHEAFELFDSNGGGTIDAEELDVTLQSVGIHLEPENIRDIMLKLDKDGNGEIDFDEFLTLMTNTEKFIVALTVESAESFEVGKSSEGLLFSALTEFMKKSALCGMDDIVDYYHSKYKRVQFTVPHVVNHYAAGARLIGLTEKQIKEHLERLKTANAGQKGLCKSPYAQPLRILTASSTNLAAQLQASRSAKKAKRGKIKLIFKLPMSKSQKEIQQEEKAEMIKSPPQALHHISVEHRGFGWVGQRTEHIEVKLPPIHLQKLLPFDDLTAEDLPNIRNVVTKAAGEYTSQRRRLQAGQNLKHWRALNVDLISPRILRDHFQVIFSHYSAVKQSLLTTSSRPMPQAVF